MNILGLCIGHDASVCLVKDGKLISSISSERILKKKKTPIINWDVIRSVINPHGLKIFDIDLVAIGTMSEGGDDFIKVYLPEDIEWPFANIHPSTHNIPFKEGYGYDVFKHNHFYTPEIDYTHYDVIDCMVEIDGYVKLPGYVVNHHTAHAASVFYTSGKDRAAIYSVDASGINASRSSAFFLGEGRDLQYLGTPGTMVGSFYNAMTELLSFGPGLTKAGTMMGAASYGKPNIKSIDNWEMISQPYHTRTPQMDDIRWNLWSGSFLTDKTVKELKMWFDEDYSIRVKRLDNWTYGKWIITPMDSTDTQDNFDLAASAQYVFEKTIQRDVDSLYEITKGLNDENLCMVGGSILNCTSNYKVLKNMKFKTLSLYPACSDDGTAVGAALYVANSIEREPQHLYSYSEICFTGNDYPDIEMGVPYDENVISKLLSESKIIAWYQGGSEFGPRALGHRSFLANPSDPNMKDILNHRVKHREWYRPFAPIVLKEKSKEWFDLDVESPYMLYTSPVLKPEVIPSVTHIDGTARVQTLDYETNPKLYNLIKKFEGITGVPVILNTSLNINGQPIVETPQDALDLFYNSDIDGIVINDKMILK